MEAKLMKRHFADLPLVSCNSCFCTENRIWTQIWHLNWNSPLFCSQETWENQNKHFLICFHWFPNTKMYIFKRIILLKYIMYLGKGGDLLQTRLCVSPYFYHCLPSGSQAELTVGCHSVPRAASQLWHSAREAMGTGPPEMGQAPVSSAQHEPRGLLGLCSLGQCKPITWWQWQSLMSKSHQSYLCCSETAPGISEDTLGIKQKLNYLTA